MMDTVMLARCQFALNICFHYIFPTFSIGLGLILVIMEGCYLWTKNPVYERMVKFWVKIFALIFAIGVGTGLVMVFAFGNNWSIFSRYVGDVFGSILGAEGIFAFFLESGFLGVLLFGWNRVSPKIHFLSTIMVAIGAHFSAVWIVIANSWMQTPKGHAIETTGGFEHAVIKDFGEVIFNPSAMTRLSHVIVACWLTGAFLVLSVSAYYLLKKRHPDFATKSMKIGLWVGGISVLLQLVTGDKSGRQVAEYQPAKLAAFEGVFETERATGLYLFGTVDAKNKKTHGIAIPGGLSLLINRNLDPVKGLDQIPREEWPNVPVVFQTYHGMIAMWGLMFLALVFALIAVWRKKLAHSKWTLRFLVIAVLFPQVGNQLGWASAEIGRQPWVVQGLLKTKDAVSPLVSRSQIIFSLTTYSLVYLLIFVLFIFLMHQKIKHGPEEPEPDEYLRQKYAVEGI